MTENTNVPEAAAQPSEPRGAVWHRDGKDRCEHGIRFPHECRECEMQQSDGEVAAWMKRQGLS